MVRIRWGSVETERTGRRGCAHLGRAESRDRAGHADEPRDLAYKTYSIEIPAFSNLRLPPISSTAVPDGINPPYAQRGI